MTTSLGLYEERSRIAPPGACRVNCTCPITMRPMSSVIRAAAI